ncbi:hypothetical protein AB0A73_10210 [Glycomyces sp. NPDC047369]
MSSTTTKPPARASHRPPLVSRLRPLLALAGTGVYAMWLYAALLDGYSRFYYALGLRQSNIALGFEQVLAPMAQVSLIFTVLIAVLAVSAWSGAVAVFSFRRSEHPSTSYVILIAVVALLVLDWSSSATLAQLMLNGHAAGILAAILVVGLSEAIAIFRRSRTAQKPRETSDSSWREIGMAVALASFGCFAVLTGNLQLPGRLATWVQVCVTVAALMIGVWWLGRPDRLQFGDASLAARALNDEAKHVVLGSRRKRFLAGTSAAVMLILLPVGAIDYWEEHMEQKGADAARLGYTDIGEFENLHPEGLRPITLTRNNVEQDPLGLCQDRIYAASLIEPSTEQQWLLLRTVDEAGEKTIRVELLPADAYNFRVESIPRPTEDGTPVPWTADACGDRQ